MAADDDSPWSSYIAIPYMIVGLLIVCENAFLILILFKSKILCHFQASSKYLFTASLGIADLLTGISMVAMPIMLSPQMAIFDCAPQDLKIAASATTSGMFLTSVIHMAFIALERFLYIAHPFFYQKHVTTRVIKMVIAITWTLGLTVLMAFTFGQILLVGTANVDRDAQWHFLKQKLFALIYMVMTTTACLSYVMILCQVRKHRHALSSLGSNSAVPKWKEQAKSLKFFLLVFGFYFLSTCPVVIAVLVFDVTRMSMTFLYALGGLAMSNSGMNFIILYVVDSKFRQKTKACLSKCACRSTCEKDHVLD